MTYGISIWGSGGSVSNLTSLFAAQKKSIRILFRLKINKYFPGHTKYVFNEKHILSSLNYGTVSLNLFYHRYLNTNTVIALEIREIQNVCKIDIAPYSKPNCMSNYRPI